VREKWDAHPEWFLFLLGCGLVVFLVSHLLGQIGASIWEYQVRLTPTSAPHYQPMTGTAYVASNTDLLAKPDLSAWAQDWGGRGSSVEILEAQWYYVRGRYGERSCYIYRLRLPSGDESKWLEQDALTQTPGAALPRDQVCYPEGYPDHSPLLGTGWEGTNVGPYRNETPGWGYVNVGEGYGALFFSVAAPYEHADGQPVVRHGAVVEVREAQWYFQADEGCYLYNVRDPESGMKGWLPEDVLSPDLSQSPPQYCVTLVSRDWMVKLLPPSSPE